MAGFAKVKPNAHIMHGHNKYTCLSLWSIPSSNYDEIVAFFFLELLPIDIHR